MKNRRNLWTIVTWREIVTKLYDNALILSTVITAAALVFGLGAMMLINSQHSKTTVAVTSQQGAKIVAAAAGFNADWVAKNYDSAKEARSAVESGEAEFALIPDANGWQAINKKSEISSMGMKSIVISAVTSTVMSENAAKAGVSLQDLSKGSAVTFTSLEDKQPAERIMAWITGIVFAFLFFTTAMLFGMQIAGSAVKEKESRVVEILAAVVPTRQLLVGKILANTVLAFAQLAIYLTIGLVGISFTGYAEFLPSLRVGAGWFAVFFITGFLALACLWAAAGAMANRYEDIQSTATPLTMILMLCYMAAFLVSGTARVVCSFVPVISSVLMPMRIVAGEAQWWEALLAVAANLVFMAGGIWVGAAIYRRGILHTSGALKWRSAFQKAA